MSINSSRNVGIGTSSPNTALQVDELFQVHLITLNNGSRLLQTTSDNNSFTSTKSGGTSAEDLASTEAT